MTTARGRVALVADALTVHHHRFLAVLAECGWEASVVLHGSRRPDGDPSRRLAADLAAARPDVVLAGPIPDVGADAVAAAPPDVPVVLTAWGSDLLVTAVEDPAAAARARAALAAAGAVVVDCRTVEAAAVALGAAPGRIVRFPWGVDLAAHPVTPLPPVATRLRVLSLRSLLPAYRVDVLVRAAAQVPDVAVTLAGGGTEEPTLVALAASLGARDRIRAAGRVDEADVPALVADHDVVVSTVPVDGSSVSLLQAMAAGRPCVVVDNPSNREWVEEGVTGWLVPVGDAEALAARLRELADPASWTVRERVAVAARARVERDADWSRNRRLLLDALDLAVGP